MFTMGGDSYVNYKTTLYHDHVTVQRFLKHVKREVYCKDCDAVYTRSLSGNDLNGDLF